MEFFLSFFFFSPFSFLRFIFFGWSYRSLSWVRVSRLLCTYQGGFQRNLKWESQEQQRKIPSALHHEQGKNLQGDTLQGENKPTCCTNHKKEKGHPQLLNIKFLLLLKKQLSRKRQTLRKAFRIYQHS